MNLVPSALVVAATLLAVLPARAADDGGRPRGVVELFTSQGCSSCPPADAALGRLVRKGGVIALAYHVDYWDYLGWRDTFSSKKFTNRQYGYSRTLGRENVYTPQAVIDGRGDTVGSDQQAIERMLAGFAASGKGLSVPVAAHQAGSKMTISVGKGTGQADLLLVYFDRKDTVAIPRGENRGRTLTYWHVVRDVQTVGMWDGSAMTVALPAAVVKNGPGGGCAILLQEMSRDNSPGPIIGATVVDGGRG